MQKSQVPILEKTWPESSNVARTKFIPGTNTLEVVFKSGATYQYRNFPQEKWDELLASNSIGKYVSGVVVKNYQATKI